jgi:hypothetical protein
MESFAPNFLNAEDYTVSNIQTHLTSIPKNMIIVPQTKVAFIGFSLLTIALVVSMVQNPKISGRYIINIIVNIATFALALYVINCTVLGRCNMYAWIVSYIAVALGIVSIVGLIFALTK